MSSIAELENERDQFQEQLDVVLQSLEKVPDNKEFLDMKKECEDAIADINASIAAAKPTDAPAVKETAEEPPVEKWSKEKHPAFQPGYRKPGAPPSPTEESHAPVSFNVNDMIMARWVSGDKGFYPAQITAVTGSSADPIYKVRFKGYDNSDSLRLHDLKPMSNNDAKKRKAPASSSSSSTPAGSSNVISAAANINQDLASQVKREPSKVSDGPPRPEKAPRKIRKTKELIESQSNWKKFNNTSKYAKTHKKESQFRTGTGVNSRVGFTGSGQAMRKDQARTKYNFKQVDEDN